MLKKLWEANSPLNRGRLLQLHSYIAAFSERRATDRFHSSELLALQTGKVLDPWSTLRAGAKVRAASALHISTRPFLQFLDFRDPFSAVSTPIVASKYLFISIFRALRYHLYIIRTGASLLFILRFFRFRSCIVLGFPTQTFYGPLLEFHRIWISGDFETNREDWYSESQIRITILKRVRRKLLKFKVGWRHSFFTLLRKTVSK